MIAGLGWAQFLMWLLFSAVVLAIGASIGFEYARHRSAVRRPRAVDVGFAQDMAAHHARATQITALVPLHSGNPSVLRFAADLDARLFERIGRMRGWLNLWGKPELPPEGKERAWLKTPNTVGGVSPGEVARLRGLRGPRFDAAFLRVMTRHAEDGLEVARFAADNAALAPVRDLAADIEADLEDDLDTVTSMTSAT